MILFDLFLNFFHIGIFSFGGGYATLPFLYEIAQNYDWYSIKDLTDMIAISSITPGPVGINMATFAGFKISGIIGSLVATTSIILPSLIFVLLISKALTKFCDNKYVKSIIYVLKPVGCGLLAATGLNLLIKNSLNLSEAIFLLILIYISTRKKLPPVFYLGMGAILGFLLPLF